MGLHCSSEFSASVGGKQTTINVLVFDEDALIKRPFYRLQKQKNRAQRFPAVPNQAHYCETFFTATHQYHCNPAELDSGSCESF